MPDDIDGHAAPGAAHPELWRRIMAFSLESERPSVAAVPSNIVRALFAWIADARAKHARRVALSSLLEMEASLLYDLGVDRVDVIEALRHPNVEAGRALSAKRARSSRDWLSHP
jgi:uncharacterized protein YjiS (DUF1127 family)